jgi:MarR family transcriptional regulator, temperature-dependent positive regulator of motility
MNAAAQHLESSPGHLIRRAQQRHLVLWNARVGGELTSVQFAVLLLLRYEPGLDQRTVSARLSIDSSTLADVCRRLEQRGLLGRSRDSGDGRRYVLTVDAAGRQLLDEALPAAEAVGEQLFGDLDAAERQTLMELLRRVVGDAP